MSLLRRWWQSYLRWRLRNVERLALAEDGFVQRWRGVTTHVRWDAIDRVAAFKRDLMTVDLICLAIEHGGALVEIHEDARGYAEVLAAMEARLGIAPEWMLTVMFPAFATNRTELFDRARGGALPIALLPAAGEAIDHDGGQADDLV